MGIRALANEDVQKKLKVTSDQKTKIDDTMKAADDDRRKMFEEMRASGGGRDGFEAMRAKFDAARKKSDDKVLAALTDEQKKNVRRNEGQASLKWDRRALFAGGRGGQPGGWPRRRSWTGRRTRVETVAVIGVADQAVKAAVIEEIDLSVRLLNNLTMRQKKSSLIHCWNERALSFRNPCQQRWAS